MLRRCDIKVVMCLQVGMPLLQRVSCWPSVYLCCLASEEASFSHYSLWAPVWVRWSQAFTFLGCLTFRRFCLQCALHQVMITRVPHRLSTPAQILSPLLGESKHSVSSSGPGEGLSSFKYNPPCMVERIILEATPACDIPS